MLRGSLDTFYTPRLHAWQAPASRQPRLLDQVREGKVNIKAGFDGEYGIISIFGKEEAQDKTEQQLSLF